MLLQETTAFARSAGPELEEPMVYGTIAEEIERKLVNGYPKEQKI